MHTSIRRTRHDEQARKVGSVDNARYDDAYSTSIATSRNSNNWHQKALRRQQCSRRNTVLSSTHFVVLLWTTRFESSVWPTSHWQTRRTRPKGDRPVSMLAASISGLNSDSGDFTDLQRLFRTATVDRTASSATIRRVSYPSFTRASHWNLKVE